jgi:MoxR-like ATPase
VPAAGEEIGGEIARFMQALRRRRLAKAPGVAETLDWAQALVRLRREHLDLETVQETLGCIVKDRHDLASLPRGELEPLVAAAREGAPP